MHNFKKERMNLTQLSKKVIKGNEEHKVCVCVCVFFCISSTYIAESILVVSATSFTE